MVVDNSMVELVSLYSSLVLESTQDDSPQVSAAVVQMRRGESDL